MARQGNTKDSETTGPESSMALDDADLESIKIPDQLNMTIPMTGSVMSPFAVEHPAPVARRPVPPEPDDEKTVKVRIPDAAALNADLPDKLAMTVTVQQPVDQEIRAALPFREGSPNLTQNFRPQVAPPPAGDFTGTLTLPLDAQLRAEIQRATPFGATKTPAPPPAAPQAIYEPQYVPVAQAPEFPDPFRNQIASSASSVPTAPAPRTIGESAVAGVFAIPLEARQLIAETMGRTAESEAKAARPDPIVLVYLERTGVPRIVRKPVWQKILDAMEDEAIDPEADDPALSSDPMEIQQQSQAYAILKHGRVVGLPAAEAALEAAVAKPGRFAPPIELFEGEIEPIFDDVERLRALCATLGPMAKDDEKLGKTLQIANQVLEAAGSTNIAPLARRQRIELQTVYQASKRAMSFDEIEALVIRGMLEQRKYRVQTILGGEHICAWFHMPGHDKPELVYVPSAAAAFLPLSRRFLARMIAEVHVPQDDEEMNALVIRCLALSKVVRKRQAS